MHTRSFILLVLFSLALVAGAASEIRLENPFPADYPVQPVLTEVVLDRALLPSDEPITLATLDRWVGLQDVASGVMLPAQWSDLQSGKTPHATVSYITDLPANSVKTLRLARKPRTEEPVFAITEAAGITEVRSGDFSVRLPSAGSTQPPVHAVARWQGDTATWYGSSRFRDAGRVTGMTVERSAAGSVFFRQVMTYHFALGTVYRCAVTCWAGQPYITVEETVSGPGSEAQCWELDLGAWPTHLYVGGHGHPHNLSKVRLEQIPAGEEIVWLPNYVMWGEPYEGMLALFARPGEDTTLLNLFQVRRGEWEDKLFAPYAFTPLSAHPETDWSKKRWWGSRFTQIRVLRNAETGALARFSLVPGSRQWALAVGDAASLPPAGKPQNTPSAPSRLKTAIGELRLTETQHYILDWTPDPKIAHPRIEMTAAMLDGLDAHAATHPYLQELAKGLKADPVIAAWQQKDPALVDKQAEEIAKNLQVNYVVPFFTGLEFAPYDSPVGIRNIFQMASRTDILLGTGKLTSGRQAQLRRDFAFIAYRLYDSSFMAWKYNAGHPNFEADRYASLAAIALLYPEHPQAKVWLDHAVSRLRESMRIYVLHASDGTGGKWAENVGCYYMWSSTVIGGLARALQRSGVADPYNWPEFQDFWRWAVLPVMPPKPAVADLSAICAGKAPAEIALRREAPGVGDHGIDGGNPLHGGIAISGVGIRKYNPQLGRELLWTWAQGSRQRIDHYPFGLFFALTREELALADDPHSTPDLHSQRLAGYGAVLRDAVGTPAESYLLFKCGPGGYRYHGDEGSFELFGLGQPLTLDGGENIKPDQHSTVTFGAENLGLRHGRLEQFASTPQVDYACGRFSGAPELIFPAEQRPALPRLAHTWNYMYGLATRETNPSWVRAQDDDDLGLLSFAETFPGERDILTRQLLFRKNDYLVINDRIDAVQDSAWHLQLLAKTLTVVPGGVQATGWLGIDARITLFHYATSKMVLEPVKAEDITIAPMPITWGARDAYVIPQQRISVRQPAGASVLAVVDFYRAGEQPWSVTADGDGVVLSAGAKRETVRLRGDGIPQATFTAGETAWQYGERAATPAIKTVAVRDGLVYINDKPFLGTGWNASSVESIRTAPGQLVRWPNGDFLRAYQDKAAGKPVDMRRIDAFLDALEQSGKYAVLIIEPYWGQRVDKWSQISWRGENRGGQGLNTNACWRNPEFIADRCQKVHDVVAMVKSLPRAHDRILGYIVWNEQRWAWNDETCYCEHCRADWAKWLAAKYNTIGALNKAYGTAYGAFADVPLPTPLVQEPSKDAGEEPGTLPHLGPTRGVTNDEAWADFHLFKADGLIAFEKAGAAAAKAADPSRLVITSLFTRDVHPNIGHVMLRLYRAMNADPNIDIIGGNTYEVLPTARAARHIAMWRDTSAAVRKPVWFTEFNEINSPIKSPYDTAAFNALAAHTAFSGCSGLLWYTDLDQGAPRLCVREPDGSLGLRYRQVREMHALMDKHVEVIAQAARNGLPAQVAIIHPDRWNALADNEYYNTASLAAQQAISQWAGFATRYLAEPEIRAGQLKQYKAAVLWQAQRAGDIDLELRAALDKYVRDGGTLICDLPFLQHADGSGPDPAWTQLLGLTYAKGRTRDKLSILDKQFGMYDFTAAGNAFPGRPEPRDLGAWDIKLMPGQDRDIEVLRDADGQPAIVIHRLGRGRVITLGFRLALVDADPATQTARALLLQQLLAQAGLSPLVDAPWLEKTLAPQDHGGLLVTAYNPRPVAVTCPLRLPGRNAAITPIYVPVGAAVDKGNIVLPAGEWVAFTVR